MQDPAVLDEPSATGCRCRLVPTVDWKHRSDGGRILPLWAAPMIFSEIRAQAWKYACIAVAVLAVAAAITATVFRIQNLGLHRDYDAAKSERDSARAEVDALKGARKRDDKSAELTTEARATVADQAAASNQRAAQIQVKYRDRIVEVPANCPVPDAGLMSELADQAARLSAAEAGLRGIGRSAEKAP